MKVTIIILIVLLSGCAGTVATERSVVVTGYDFSEYTKKGFLFTPEQYLESYESMGLITISVTPAVKEFTENYDSEKYWKVTEGSGNKWLVEKTGPQLAIEEAYKAAVAMGADAITRFEVSSRIEVNGTLGLKVYDITGFAIKRKQ